MTRHQLIHSLCKDTSKKIRYFANMSAAMMRIVVSVMCVVAVLLSVVHQSEGTYKNAPMNGIMFGKRAPADYDPRAKTFAALCEIANEACQVWFPSQLQENK